MKLNFDAMRQLLFALEDQPRNIELDNVLSSNRLQDFTHEEIGYALEKLIEAGLVKGKCYGTKTGVAFLLDSISIDGHKFLDDIRNDTVWKKVYNTVKCAGMTSIKSVLPVAAKFTFDHLGL